MLRFILLLIGGAISIFLTALSIRYLLRASFAWDTRICNKLGSTFCGFRRHFRMPTAIGVIPEFFYFLVLGRDNYFNARWWALRMASYISFLFFLAVIFSRSSIQAYYSWSYFTENGIMAYITAGSGFWYLHMINILMLGLIVMILVESIKMHKGWAPVRFIFYTIMSFLMAYTSLMVLALIISFTILYICYKIIRFFMSSNRNRKIDVDDDDDVSDKLNNTYRRFRAELYEWERDRKAVRRVEKEERKTVIKRKRPKIERKPKTTHVDDDIQRIHPE